MDKYGYRNTTQNLLRKTTLIHHYHQISELYILNIRNTNKTLYKTKSRTSYSLTDNTRF